MPSLDRPALFDRLDGAERVLLVGVGGGYDVYAGVPLGLHLAGRGTTMTWANRTFVETTGNASLQQVGGSGVLHRLRPDRTDASRLVYFPEWHLAQWRRENGAEEEVYLLGRSGVRPTRQAIDDLIATARPEAIVAVDGGTDALLRGDESGLGTPVEDAVTILALDQAARERGIDAVLVSLGFGVDAHHGVAHAEVLARMADLSRQGHLLGTVALTPDMPEVSGYCALVDRATAANPDTASIVNTSITAAVHGHFGDHHPTARTAGSRLFVNPLMATMFAFDLAAVADAYQYGDALASTSSFEQAAAVVAAHRRHLDPPARPSLPM